MFTKAYVINFMIISVVFISCSIAETIEPQIGPINFDKKPLTESQWTSFYGPGYVDKKKIGNKIIELSHIYFIENENLWVKIQFSHVKNKSFESMVESVLVTRKKICDEKFKPKKQFNHLKTSRGIKIGDSLEKVIKVYGKPTVDIVNVGNKTFSVLKENLPITKGRVLRYLPKKHSELNFVEFYFDDVGLNSILISESE